MAIGFSMLVNLALMTSLIWSELTTSGMRTIAWILVGLVWALSATASYGWHRDRSGRQQGRETPLADGLEYYLQKNWFEAERVFRRLLRRNSRDTDARLMLATLLRHTERFEEAEIQLDRLRRIEGSQKWDLEIEQEQRLLDKVKSDKEEAGNDAGKDAGEDNFDNNVLEEPIPAETSLEEESKTHAGPEEPSADDRQAA